MINLLIATRCHLRFQFSFDVPAFYVEQPKKGADWVKTVGFPIHHVLT